MALPKPATNTPTEDDMLNLIAEKARKVDSNPGVILPRTYNQDITYLLNVIRKKDRQIELEQAAALENFRQYERVQAENDNLRAENDVLKRGQS